MSRKTSLPASAHECTASATIDADDVSTAATVFAVAMRMLTRKAMRTVTSPTVLRVARASRCGATWSYGCYFLLSFSDPVV